MADFSIKPSEAQQVVVEWEDITGYDNWNEDDGPFHPTSIVQIGWLLEDNNRWLTIGGSYDHTNEKWGDITVIPKMPPIVTPQG